MIKSAWNLAPRPFRNYALYSMAFRVGALSLFAVTFLHVLFILDAMRQKGDIQAALEEDQKQIAQLEKETAQIQQRIRREGVAELNARTAWANQLLERRSFSWTRLLADLEEVLPVNVLVQSISPSASKGGVMALQLQTVSRTPADLAELLDALEASPYFSRAYPSQEREDLVKGLARGVLSSVSVLYHPEGPPAAAEAEALISVPAAEPAEETFPEDGGEAGPAPFRRQGIEEISQ